MIRTQVYLDERQVRRLRRLAAVTGKTHSQLIREAVDRLEAPRERTAVLAEASGAWGPEGYEGDPGTLRREAEERLARAFSPEPSEGSAGGPA